MRRKIFSDQLLQSDLDLTSLLDVIFILLIFTMLAVQLETIRTIDLDLVEAESQAGSSIHLESNTIRILEDGSIGFQDKEINLSELKLELVKKEWQNLEWNIIVEKKVEFQNFVEILSLVRQTNPKTIDLGVKEK
ncbi:MAG: biopolymer transporter ExbD [Leptospiraceae bacterium]|jgi:biopolymer transport protein ExbD|nr:biopolymer transporter ExbD [Leptospiraceae bacterium]MCZ8346084.1 biopolymer transporter ExbD [Leptospiraceae bacterium]